MKNILIKLGSALSRTWAWTLLLVLFIALVVWFAGPLLAVADHRFWESPISRLVFICGLLLVWGLSMVYVNWRSGVRKKIRENRKAGQQRIAQEKQIEQRQRELHHRFKDALQVLKNSSLYAGRTERARQDLPWYLVLGAPASGKTSLLDFSGLDFPLNRGERKLTRDTKGTEHSAWYFAEQAVLIDTPGRHLVQAEGNADGADWRTLLRLMHQRRRTQPLNGVIVTLDLDQVMNQPEAKLLEAADTVRERLHEMYRTLGVDLPVYLVLTKSDAISGFDEFFDLLTRENANQVFGATFSKDQRGADVDVLRQEFEALLQRLNQMVIKRLQEERDTERRSLILAFPHRLGQLGPKLCRFVDAAFTGNRYQRATLLRGFYLTRAPHVPRAKQPQVGEAEAVEVAEALPVLPVGRARFIHDLFSQVIFPEAGLAGLSKDHRRRIHWGQRALYGVAAAIVAVASGVWISSFTANHDRLEQVRVLGTKLEKERVQLHPQDDALAMLTPLNTSYQTTLVFPAASDARLYERSGLYQGEPSNQVLHQAYQSESTRLMLPRVAQMLESQVRSSLQDRDQLLASLRAYLMLNLPERREATWLKDRVTADWSRRYPGNTQAQTQLGEHFERLLKQSFVYPLNENLVAQARQVLRSESLANVVYRVLREQNSHLPEYRFAQHVGAEGAVLAGTDYAIPGFYTRKGYQEYFVAQGANGQQDPAGQLGAG